MTPNPDALADQYNEAAIADRLSVTVLPRVDGPPPATAENYEGGRPC